MHSIKAKRAERREREKGRWFVSNVGEKGTCKRNARAQQFWVKEKGRVKRMGLETGLEREKARGKGRDQKAGVLNAGDSTIKVTVQAKGP